MKALAGRAARFLAGSGALGALEAADRSTDRVRILTYHRIAEPDAEPDLDPGLISAAPADFRDQMELVAARYHPISLDELLTAHLDRRPLPRGAVLVTFDDGYRDFATNAWPILRELGIPAVLFVPTRFPGGTDRGFWWDRLHSALRRTLEQEIWTKQSGALPLADEAQRRAAHRALRMRAKSMPHAEAIAWIEGVIARLADDLPAPNRVLDWDALRQLAREGLRVCAHGEVHALLTRLSPSDLAKELVHSRARIEAELGADAPPPVLAYPASACDARVFEAVEEAGYLLAFGGERGIERLPLANPFDLMRLPVLRYGAALFRAQLRPSVSRLGSMLVARRA